MRRETRDGRQDMGDRRWETGYGRQDMGDRIWETEDGRQETADRRQENGFSDVISEKFSAFNPLTTMR